MSSTAAHISRPAGREAIAERVRRWAPAIAGALSVVLLAATAEIVLDGAVGHSALVPRQPEIAGWMIGVGERLGYRVFLIALLSFIGAYMGMLGLAKRVSARWAVALVAALHVIVFIGPVLISTDVFSYIAYARMGVLHGANPYLHGPIAISTDPIYRYVGVDWKRVATAYGPLYTLSSYPLALLGIHGAIWSMKLEAMLASFGTLALTWRCARRRGVDPVFALLLVGANPLYVIYGLGGAHNDVVMTLLMMSAAAFVLAGRQAAGGAAIMAGALAKATAGVMLPFMVLSTRRMAPIVGALVMAALVALAAFFAFGVHGIDVISALNRDAALVSTDSFPNEIAHLFGKPGVFPVDHDLLKIALVVVVLHLMWRTWRGYDWIAASAWTLLAITIVSTWLLAWYTLWSLPLAAITRERRLVIATLLVQALYIVHQTSPLFAPVS